MVIKLLNVLLILVVFVNLLVSFSDGSQQQNKTLINKDDECFNYIPEEIVDKVYLFQPDNGGLKDQVIKSTPQKSHHTKNTKKNEKNTKLYYLLKNLLPNTQYAIRISYTASSPTDYKIKFFDNPLITTQVLNKFIKSEKKNTRDLLNTEIIKFKTDGSGYVIESHEFDTLKLNPCSVITIEAVNIAISPTFVQGDLYKYQSFDLIMDTEAIGVPPEIPKLVFIILITIIVVFIFFKKFVFSNKNF
ncbi:hypothetical protein DICPUDRAFT_97082 [Dictyostelium purpureum]|uniref:Malectin domain-containing protein n=1 Tax=Dictyostelium purpureum TaxID=5786 RepID=F0ZDR6_DICPU|nr:uncharacterized protein DICPUDRAFT_97082 [Dictyostelium purpureum]EGC37893.1 hypothetical protein DICPUDRAFT_97082 [Dictyostelium purpureum]|eukprot:XP_003285553.1 hypothetical protein DICPUDRAFT_97082 [Dictyostelium purpureum]